jgi:hypothetical protein
MSRAWWRKLVPGKRLAVGRRRPHQVHRTKLAIEELEKRDLPSIAALSLATPGFPVDTAGGNSLPASSSADGRYLAFLSTAANLVPGQVDSNGGNDVFLYDRVAGTMTLVSHGSAGSTTAGNGPSQSPVISADGNFIAYVSAATDLVAGVTDAKGSTDVFLFNRALGTTTLVTRSSASAGQTASDSSTAPALSSDGHYLVFTSLATDLVAGQSTVSGTANVFVFDRVANAMALVSHASSGTSTGGNASSADPVISADGRFVAFDSSATNLSPNQADSNGGADVFLYDQVAGTTTLVSHSSASATTAGNDISSNPVIDGDGGFIAFQSQASDLVTGQADTNGTWDVFLYNRTAGTTTLVSHNNGAGTTAGNALSIAPAISSSGRFVAFVSAATGLVAGQADTNNGADVFLYDGSSGTNTLVSHASGASTTTANNSSDNPVLSADGSLVAFTSNATNLVPGQVDGNNGADVFLYNATAGTTTLASHSSASSTTAGDNTSSGPVLSADGSVLALASNADNLVAGLNDTNQLTDVFQYNTAAATTTVVSGRTPTLAAQTANGDSTSAAVSGDGRFVAFQSNATNLVTGQVDGNNGTDVFLLDRTTHTTVLVSHTSASSVTTGNGASEDPAISADGRFVTFVSSAANLVSGQVQTQAGTNVFLYDRLSGTITLISHASGALATTGNSDSSSPALSADGAFVAFASSAANLVPGQASGTGGSNIFLYDRASGALTLVSHSSTGSTTTANDLSFHPVLSADGSTVAFLSDATDLVANQVDGNNSADVFLYSRVSGITTLVSHASASPTTAAGGGAVDVTLNADGSFVAFTSTATNLVPAQANSGGSPQVFLYNRAAGTTTLVSHSSASGTTAGNDFADEPVLSSDGSLLAFTSQATNLVPGQTGSAGISNVFLFNRLTGATTLVSHAAGSATAAANGASRQPALSANGNVLTFASAATNLVAGQTEPVPALNLFSYNIPTGTTTLASQVPGAPTTTGDGDSLFPVLSADGTVLVFESSADNLVAGDLNGHVDLFSQTNPLGTIQAVSPSPRSTSVSSITITFNEPVTGFTLASLQLLCMGVNVLTAAQTLTTSDNMTWTLGNLAGLTDPTHRVAGFTLIVNPAGITDAAGSTVSISGPLAFVVVDPALTLQGTVLTVSGTAGNDSYTFTAGSPELVSLNGVPYTVDPTVVGTVQFQGNGGQDTATLSAAGTGNTATLALGSGTLQGNGYKAVVSGVTTLLVQGGSTDTAVLSDTAGSNTFIGSAAYSYLTNGTLLSKVSGFKTVVASSTSGSDTAWLYEPAGNHTTFVGTPLYAYLSTNGTVVTEAMGFHAVMAVGAANTTDAAYLFDSPGNDAFVSTPGYAYLTTAAGVVSEAIGFPVVVASSQGGSDSATLYDSVGSSTFFGTPGYSYLVSNGVLDEVIGFQSITASAAANDNAVANLQDTTGTGNNLFVGTPAYSYLRTGTVLNEVIGFQSVTGDATAGGSDSAYLYDAAGESDTFVATPRYAYLRSSGNLNRVLGFQQSTAYASAGNSDSAYLYGSAGNDTLVGTPTSTALTAAGVFSQASGFASVVVIGGGGSGVALLSDGPSGGTFVGQGNSALLYGAGYGIWVDGFGQVTAYGSTGINHKYVGAINYLFNTVGMWV